MDKDAAQVSEKSPDTIAEDAVSPEPNTKLSRMPARLKLKIIADYVVDGFAPFVAVAALIVAVVAANGNRSSHAELAQRAEIINSLNASLLASKNELEKLKSVLAQEKLSKDEELKKQEERMMKVIHEVSTLQVKMKISPTLNEQINPPASAAAVIPAVALSATAPAHAVVPPATQATVLKNAIDKFNKK
jgi:hypothetical protein